MHESICYCAWLSGTDVIAEGGHRPLQEILLAQERSPHGHRASLRRSGRDGKVSGSSFQYNKDQDTFQQQVSAENVAHNAKVGFSLYIEGMTISNRLLVQRRQGMLAPSEQAEVSAKSVSSGKPRHVHPYWIVFASCGGARRAPAHASCAPPMFRATFRVLAL